MCRYCQHRPSTGPLLAHNDMFNNVSTAPSLHHLRYRAKPFLETMTLAAELLRPTWNRYTVILTASAGYRADVAIWNVLQYICIYPILSPDRIVLLSDWKLIFAPIRDVNLASDIYSCLRLRQWISDHAVIEHTFHMIGALLQSKDDTVMGLAAWS